MVQCWWHQLRKTQILHLRISPTDMRNSTAILTNLIEVEREFSGNGTVEPGLEVGGPVLCKDVLSTGVLLANTCHS